MEQTFFASRQGTACLATMEAAFLFLCAFIFLVARSLPAEETMVISGQPHQASNAENAEPLALDKELAHKGAEKWFLPLLLVGLVGLYVAFVLCCAPDVAMGSCLRFIAKMFAAAILLCVLIRLVPGMEELSDARSDTVGITVWSSAAALAAWSEWRRFKKTQQP